MIEYRIRFVHPNWRVRVYINGELNEEHNFADTIDLVNFLRIRRGA